MRKLKRLVARSNMKRSGIIRINKKNGKSSFFSEHWREYVTLRKNRSQRGDSSCLGQQH